MVARPTTAPIPAPIRCGRTMPYRWRLSWALCRRSRRTGGWLRWLSHATVGDAAYTAPLPCEEQDDHEISAAAQTDQDCGP